MRLAFSVAAHLEPEIMLIDEVLAVGDQEFQNRCFGRIDEIEKEGRTVVFISHNMGAVRRLCRRGVLLNDGHLVADGPTDGVMESYYTMISATQPVEGMEVEGDGDGTGDHALLSWSLSSPADLGAYTVPAGSPCEFRFRVRLSKAVPHGYMMLAIYSHDGILISRHTSMDAQEIFWHFEPGVHEATFALPFFPLSPGRYEPLLILGNRDGETVESWHPRPEFQVVGQGEPASEMDREGGLIVLPSEFSIQPLEPR